MPWNESTVMNERYKFAMAYAQGLAAMSELCSQYRISRPTGYKWVRRFEASGRAGLSDQSRAAHRCPHRMNDEVAAWMVQQRRQHPHWGARKILACFKRRYADSAAPSRSAVSQLFKRAGLSARTRQRRRASRTGCAAQAVSEPNQLWTMDFKGHFRTGDHRYCYPLTVMDRATRYLLGCRGGLNIGTDWVKTHVDQLFREHGLPVAIHSDNGSPFAGYHSVGRLSRLSVHWLKLGIAVEHSRPACPQDNAAHERMHRTLKAHTARPPAANLRLQQGRFNRFLREYNQERPHEALGDRTPAQLYRCSPRQYPSRLPTAEYPGHFETRHVRKGCFKWRGNLVFIGKVLNGEVIGLQEVDDGLWSLYFFEHLLASFDEREGMLKRRATV
jgi:transposase InsO family protein